MNESVNVYWLSYHENILSHGFWDNALLDDTFKKGNFIHHEIKCSEFPVNNKESGGVFIINGRTHIEDTDKINADIAKLSWVLFIVTGDEEALFPWRKITHPRMRVWIMLPRMNQHDDVSFRLPQGYRQQTAELIKEIGYKEKTIDWMFAGQITHERREQCAAELRYLIDSGKYPNGILSGTKIFGQEKIPYKEYLEMMAQTKIVLCPSGPETPDSFRLYEALEAGCVPVVDQFSTNFKNPGFWKYVFGDDIPFPIVDYWDALPNLMPELLRNYPELSVKCQSWWIQRKKIIFDKLNEDIKELSK